MVELPALKEYHTGEDCLERRAEDPRTTQVFVCLQSQQRIRRKVVDMLVFDHDHHLSSID